ncbi:MAG: hypothetical protein KDE09_04540 [Anaerolineales bacterium]|nr:hypothetical protein [Anaerolineales bacterium]MCB0008184.1 hypothetical protein [Anaerolineales bacterium]MCB0017035.1 hypothetical protein [Anaerolineales bacterium]MCB0029885.1 hypothetical protein [Anaerolineales bacterium]MCB8961667.1 hypothetical protein [Ardenticatenales bacterium]
MNSRFRPDLRIPAIALSGATLYIIIYVALQLLHPPAVHPAVAADEQIGNTTCRVGVSLGNTDAAAQISWIPFFKVGWYITFATASSNVPSNVEFVPLIGVYQMMDGDIRLPDYTTSIALTDAGLGARIAANPGALWIVGNEVDRLEQGDIEPQIYAIAYHDIYEFIKERDPSAQVAVSGLVEVTPGRLQYLDMVWDAYREAFNRPMPVDVWTMHLYILPEVDVNGEPNFIASVAIGTDPALGKRESGGSPIPCPQDNVYCYAEHDDINIFAQQVEAMRGWMADHNYQRQPLLITEYSILWPYRIDPNSCFLMDEYGNCFTPDRISNWVVETFAYLKDAKDPLIGNPLDDDRLVQQWMWYSLNTRLAGDSSDLLNEEFTGLTQVGEVFRQEVANVPLYVNLAPESPAHTATNSNGDATLSVRIYNNGSTTTDKPFEVSFYRDAFLTDLIGSVTVPPVAGCVREQLTATVVWEDVPAGLHNYWVAIDSFNKIPESNEVDNVTTGAVLADPVSTMYLPISLR